MFWRLITQYYCDITLCIVKPVYRMRASVKYESYFHCISQQTHGSVVEHLLATQGTSVGSSRWPENFYYLFYLHLFRFFSQQDHFSLTTNDTRLTLAPNFLWNELLSTIVLIGLKCIRVQQESRMDQKNSKFIETRRARWMQDGSCTTWDLQTRTLSFSTNWGWW